MAVSQGFPTHHWLSCTCKEQFGWLHSMQALRIRIPKSTDNTQLLHSLIKVCEEVDSEGVLLIQLVSICILHSIHSVGGRHVLQENVPASKENQSTGHCSLHNRLKIKKKQWGWIKNSAQSIYKITSCFVSNLLESTANSFPFWPQAHKHFLAL